MASWDRQPEEPPRAFAHFTQYRDIGPPRTLENTAKIRGVALSTLLELSAKWNWVARCDQWDAHLQATHDRAMVTEAAKKGRERAGAYSALLARAKEALKAINLEQATLAQVATAMKVACEGMRLEDGLATAHVTAEIQDATFILSRLPAEVREGLRGVLDRYAEAERGPLGLGVAAGAGDGEPDN